MEILWEGINGLTLAKGRHVEDLRILFGVAYYCGLRMSEALKIYNYDIDIENKSLHLHAAKRDNNVRVVLPPYLLEPLREYLETTNNPNRHILGADTKDGTPAMAAVRLWLKELGKRHNIEALTTAQAVSREKAVTHAFRKSYAKLLFFRGCKIEIISRILRHASTLQTEQYLQLPPSIVYQYYYTDQEFEPPPFPKLQYLEVE